MTEGPETERPDQIEARVAAIETQLEAYRTLAGRVTALERRVEALELTTQTIPRELGKLWSQTTARLCVVEHALTSSPP